MYIKKVKLENFRNYDNLEIELKKDFNLIYGDNAQGKTNILESIYLCAIGRSFQTNKDSELIKIGKDKAKIEVDYVRKDREGKINIEISDKKIFFINGIKQKKLSDIIGKINIVLFYPDNINIIKGSPADRRKFLDIMISQLKPNYIHILNRYLKTLEQRNIYLKQIKFDNKSKDMLEIWDERLAELSYQIYIYRNEYIQKIKEKIKNIHNKITNCGKQDEEIEIIYISSGKTKEEYYKDLIKNRENDIRRGFTSTGSHRDDFDILINNKKVNIYGSQGQARTSVLSLKLAELEIIYDEIDEEPILLLDDFMSELDENRRNNLTKAIKNNQVFITCTDKIIVEDKNNTIYHIENAKLKKGN
ncbi:MAG: DNA replication/repair protein RecF [Clostridia bacterium]|nr:DNA replication/repair protein RecF [Clostridia bacterium]